MPGDAFGLAAEGHEGRAGVRGSRELLDETASERPSTSLQWVVASSIQSSGSRQKTCYYTPMSCVAFNKSRWIRCLLRIRAQLVVACQARRQPPRSRILTLMRHISDKSNVGHWSARPVRRIRAI